MSIGVWDIGGGGSVPDADAYTKGKILLAGQLGGTADSPTVVGITESGGQALPIGAIADWQLLVRSGTSVVGTTEGTRIQGAASKTTPADTDLIGIADSAASWVLKALSWANLKTALNSALSFIPSTQKAAASGVASLDAGSLVVQNPTNATATKTASKIPIADTNGLLDAWITPDKSTVKLLCYTVDGGGSVISSGLKGYFRFPFAGTINSWTMISDVSGSVKINIWKRTLPDVA